MKRIVKLISVMAVSILFSPITILAADNSPMSFGSFEKDMQFNQKNECLLVAKNCATDADSVQQRLNDLRNEIAKGYRVYTPAELNRLKEQLKWIVSESENTTI